MNLSKDINPELCSGCGLCCKKFVFWFMKGDDFEVAGEPFRILNLKGLNARLIEDTGFVGIELDYPCKFLIEKNGVYSCEIYNSKERPLLCRLYPYPDYSDCPNKKKEVGK